MKIDCLAGGQISSIQLDKTRSGRFEMKVWKFEKNIGAEPLERGIMEVAQLKQLAKKALELAGEKDLADQIPKFRTPWGS